MTVEQVVTGTVLAAVALAASTVAVFIAVDRLAVWLQRPAEQRQKSNERIPRAENDMRDATRHLFVIACVMTVVFGLVGVQFAWASTVYGDWRCAIVRCARVVR